jgi:hypothetical protein
MLRPSTTSFASLSSKFRSWAKVEKSINIPLSDIPETLIDDNFKILKPYLDSYDMELGNLFATGRVKRYYDKVKTDFKLIKKTFKDNEIILSFVIGFRGWSRKALLSIQTLLKNKLSNNIEIIIVEQSSDDPLNIDKISLTNQVSYYKIETQSNVWDRETVLNYGIEKSKGKHVAIWDICFLCNDRFVEKLLSYVKQVDFNKNIFSVAVYESHDLNNRKKYEGYGNMWIYDVDKIKNNTTDFNNLNRRLGLGILHSMYLDPTLYVIHISHLKENILSKSLISRPSATSLDTQYKLNITDTSAVDAFRDYIPNTSETFIPIKQISGRDITSEVLPNLGKTNPVKTVTTTNKTTPVKNVSTDKTAPTTNKTTPDKTVTTANKTTPVKTVTTINKTTPVKTVTTINKNTSVKTVPEPVKTVPEPVKTVPEPVKTVPEPVKTVPEPVKTVPEPVKTVPEPVPEPVKNKANNFSEYYIFKVIDGYKNWVEIYDFDKCLSNDINVKFEKIPAIDGIYILEFSLSNFNWKYVDDIEQDLIEKLIQYDGYPMKNGIYILAVKNKNRYWLELKE